MMAMGVSALKRELTDKSFVSGGGRGACASVCACARARVWGGGGRGASVCVQDCKCECKCECLYSRPTLCAAAHAHALTHANRTPLHTRARARPRPPEMPEIHQFLDGFYLSRIGIRMLIGQHISLHEPPKAAHIGLICTKCSPWQARAKTAAAGAGRGWCS